MTRNRRNRRIGKIVGRHTAVAVTIALFALLLVTTACGSRRRERQGHAKNYYAIALETETVCEQLVEECLRNWRGGNWGNREGCPAYLLGDGKAKEVRSQALLSMLQDLDEHGAPILEIDGALGQDLRSLYKESEGICNLVDKRGPSYSDVQREFYRRRDRFHNAQRSVLERMPVTSVEANKLYGRLESKLEQAEDEILARNRVSEPSTARAGRTDWQRSIDRQAGSFAGSDSSEVGASGLRRLSDAERGAARLALEYMTQGPGAWWNSLAPDSWLSQLGRQRALAEIETRAGPRQGSLWELQSAVGGTGRDTAIFAIQLPSGLDEFLELELVSAGESWKILSMRNWVDARSTGPGTAGTGNNGSSGEIGSLLPLRRELARDPRPEEIQEILANQPSSPELQAVATIWQAELFLRNGDLNSAETLLASLPFPGQRTATEVLRGRLAFLRGNDVEAAAAFERAIDGPRTAEGLVLEAAEAMSLLGFQRRSQELFEKVAAAGSRRAEVYYQLARAATTARDDARAVRLFEIGWTLEPLERREVLGDQVLSYLVRDGGLLDLLEVGEAQEPSPHPRDIGATPIKAPDKTAALFHGRHLRLRVKDSVLAIPAGIRLAPSHARSEDPREKRLAEEERLLADLQALERSSRSASALIQPRLREQITLAAKALARHNRWEDLVELTESIAGRPEQLPSELASLRADALNRIDRAAQAKQLLVRVAKSRANQKMKDPQPFYELGLLLAADGQYDEAERLVRIAESLSVEQPIHSLLARIRLEGLLNRSFLTRRSEHFEVRYPPGTPDYFVEKLAEALEQELDRLQLWIPWKPTERIEVQLYDFDEFFRAFAPGRDVLGLFDGKVRVPFANLPTLHPRLLGVLTHELTHALIAGATSDQAPHWFHEGLAQHVEPLQEQVNPIGDYQKVGTFLSFPLLEPVLGAPSDPYLITLGYGEAVWVVHYLEAKYGARGIRNMVDAFAQGRTTEEALEQVLRTSMEEFDEDVWRWCLDEAPAAWPVEVVRYDLGPPEGIGLSRDQDR